MKKLAVISLAFAATFTVAQTPDATCAKAPALDAVRSTIHRNFLIAIGGRAAPADVFMQSTTIVETSPGDKLAPRAEQNEA